MKYREELNLEKNRINFQEKGNKKKAICVFSNKKIWGGKGTDTQPSPLNISPDPKQNELRKYRAAKKN